MNIDCNIINEFIRQPSPARGATRLRSISSILYPLQAHQTKAASPMPSLGPEAEDMSNEQLAIEYSTD